MEREYEISIIRIISTVFIVTCHIQQHYNIGLCWWFNVGVQIFFFMSGYLLGANVDKNAKWMFRRIKRIFVDYYIYILIIVCLYYLFTPETITLQIIIDLLCGKKTIYGAEQLWFIRPLILCYLHIFLIDYFVSRMANHKVINKIIGSAIILVGCFFFSVEVDSHWLVVFISGYIVKKLFNTGKNHLFVVIGTGIPTLVLTYLRIVDSSNNYYSKWWHVFGGIFIFMFMYYSLRKINLQFPLKIKKILNFTDKYTYDIYITHWLFITSYFSVLEITKYIAINFAILLFSILVSAYILFFISRFVNNKIDQQLGLIPGNARCQGSCQSNSSNAI